jgi:uncharacterized protein YjbJ (UPF0337 family)
MADGAKDVVGKVREKLGWLTADREEEAKGRLIQADAEGVGSDGGDEATEEAVEQAELEVRDEYGELAPEARPD